MSIAVAPAPMLDWPNGSPHLARMDECLLTDDRRMRFSSTNDAHVRDASGQMSSAAGSADRVCLGTRKPTAANAIKLNSTENR